MNVVVWGLGGLAAQASRALPLAAASSMVPADEAGHGSCRRSNVAALSIPVMSGSCSAGRRLCPSSSTD